MNQQRLTYAVRAQTVAPGVSRATIEGKSATVDLDTSAGQSDALAGPADLLVTAFAACVLKNVERMSGMQPFAYEAAEIVVTAERETTPPRISRIHYVLTLTTSESPRRVELLHRNIAQQGTIYNTLAAVAEVTGEVVVSPLTT